MAPCIPKKVPIFLLIATMVIVFACGRKGPSWGDILDKQMDQPNSIIQVDTEVVDFMIKYKIPGMSIAISKNGRMIYSKGYGFADKSIAAEVNTKTLFRIGRVSGLLTSIAIMKLIGDGKISLKSKVFGDSGILGNQYGALPYERNITNIDVSELLHHNAGGWSGTDDLVWNSKYLDMAINPGQLISYTLKNVPLRTSPGSTFAFSNLGYLVLGRIVEKVSGMSYQDFVKEKILKELGVSDMHIEGNAANKRQKNETIYYKDGLFHLPIIDNEKTGEECYPYSALGDACFGWIASAEDLLKIIANLDDSTSKTPILSARGLKMLLSADTTNPHVACGIFWNDNFSNWFDLGTYRGSSSEIAHTHDGYCWAILVNIDRPASETYLSDMDQIFWKAVGNPGTKWPDTDLFDAKPKTIPQQ